MIIISLTEFSNVTERKHTTNGFLFLLPNYSCTDTSLIQTPLYYGQFPMSQQNSHIFSLKYSL